MGDKHDIETYSKLAIGASFYLEQSFVCIDSALSYEFASILFSKAIEKIDPTKEDRKLFEKMVLPESPVDVLQADFANAQSDETAKKMSDLWQLSQLHAQKNKHKFGLDHKIDSIEILGHLNSFGFFFETLINRHLLFLKQSELIDDFSYSRISVARIMERLIYIFKEELSQNNIQINELTNLFKLRNKTVHFTPDNALALKPRISELIKIWNQCAKVLTKLEEKERFNEEKFSAIVLNYALQVQSKWN